MQLANSKPQLWLHASVENHLLELPPSRCEIGGWLLGYWSSDENDVFVTHATPPGPRGRPWGVRISGVGHRERFDAAWASSGGAVTFLGDWHTHPGGPAVPSERDRGAMRKLAADENYGTPQPLIAIASIPRWRWSRSASEVRFFLQPLDGAVKELTPRATTHLPDSAARVPEWAWP